MSQELPQAKAQLLNRTPSTIKAFKPPSYKGKGSVTIVTEPLRLYDGRASR